MNFRQGAKHVPALRIPSSLDYRVCAQDYFSVTKSAQDIATSRAELKILMQISVQDSATSSGTMRVIRGTNSAEE
jgi:hypothetical protein